MFYGQNEFLEWIVVGLIVFQILVATRLTLSLPGKGVLRKLLIVMVVPLLGGVVVLIYEHWEKTQPNERD